MFNLFSRKKEDPYQANMTSATTGKAVYGGSSWKPAPTPTISSMQSAVFPTYSTNKTPQFSQQTKLPQMSVAPKTIQGSGMTSNYASNPTNYKPPAPVAPPPVAPPQFKPVATPSAYDQQTQAVNDFLKKMQAQTSDRIGETNRVTEQNANLIGQRYDLMGQAIKGQSTALNDFFTRFKSNQEADIQDVTNLAESQKQQAQDYYGEANRTAAQARQETSQQATRKFAGQGSIDSAGAGSYREATENIDSDFNRTVQQNARALAAKQMEVDTAVGQYQRQAKTLIANEEAKLMQSLKEIEIQYADNEIGKQQAMNQVYQEAQSRVYQIQDQMSAIEQQALEQKNNIALELQKLDASRLSPEFMKTLKPTNQTELDWLVKNGESLQKMGMLGGGGGTAQKTIDSEFGKQYAAYVSGGGASDVNKQLEQLEYAAKLLDGQEASFGPMAGRMPARDAFYPKAYEAEQLIKEVVQRNLRAILGAQFTEREGELLMARAFDPKVGLEQNQKRLDSLISQIKQAAKAKEAAINYYEQNGTLQGFQGKLFTSISDFNIDDGGATTSSANQGSDPLGIL